MNPMGPIKELEVAPSACDSFGCCYGWKSGHGTQARHRCTHMVLFTTHIAQGAFHNVPEEPRVIELNMEAFNRSARAMDNVSNRG